MAQPGKNTPKYPAGVRRAKSKTTGEEIWVVNVKKTAQARGIECIGLFDFVLTENELKIIGPLSDLCKEKVALVKKMFHNADVVYHGTVTNPEHLEIIRDRGRQLDVLENKRI